MDHRSRQSILEFLAGLAAAAESVPMPSTIDPGTVDDLRVAIARTILDWLEAAPVPPDLATPIKRTRFLLARVASADAATDSTNDARLEAAGHDLVRAALEHGIVPVTPEVGRRLLTRDSWALLDLSDPACRGILVTALKKHGHPAPQGVIGRLDRMTGS